MAILGRLRRGLDVVEDEAAVVSARMRGAVRLWMRLYAGEMPWATEEDSVSLGLPAFVAGEIARMATIEMRSRVVGSARAEYLDGEYQRVIAGARRFTELAAAGGTLVLKPYVENGRILVDTVRAGAFTPTAFDGTGRMTGCVFTERAEAGGRVYIRHEAHALVDGGYRITNRVVEQLMGTGKGREAPLDVVPRWAGLCAQVLLAGVTRPLFAVLKMPGANVVEPDSHMGVSCYARAIDLMREADKQFARLLWEMESGERALYVDVRAFAPEEMEMAALPARRLYRTIDVDPQADTLFEAWSPVLREQQQVAALNEILERVEDACALSRGTLSKAPESASRGARTATELKIMRQRTYAVVRDVQQAVECALRELLGAMDVWAGVCRLAPEGAWQVGFEFDDSVVTDRAEEFAERVKLVELGAMEAGELRTWYLGEGQKVVDS